MTTRVPRSFGAQLKAFREASGYTQEELAAIAGVSVHAVSALERGQRRRPQFETVRALSAALDLTGTIRDAFVGSARSPGDRRREDAGGAALPVPVTALIGRDADIQTLRAWLADPAARLITLTGPGGVGKTRLAVELAREIAEAGAIRVEFVPLDSTRDPVFVATAIAEALALSDVSAADLPRRARVACDDRPTLLVLDNFEQVLDAAPIIATLLSAAPALRLLVTSRAALRVRGEREYALGPLTLDRDPDAMSPRDAADVPAVLLFVERVREAQPDFRLSSANGPVVSAICRRLDALPLALELAAPWMKVLTADMLLRRLMDDVLPATIASRDLPERQQTMNATVAWSYHLLDAGEQRAFRRFGVLPGPFSIDAAAAVLAGRAQPTAADEEHALAAAASLIDRSLLTAEDSSAATCARYRMLQTVRAYAASALDAAGERDEAMEGLVRYCAGEASLAAAGLVGPAQIEWLDRVREDLESHRAVLGWLLERGRDREAAQIAWGLLFFWVIRGHAAEGRRWYEQILSRDALPPDVASTALLGAAVMCYAQGEHDRARIAAQRALALASADNVDIIAQADHLLGHVEYAVGNQDEGQRRFSLAIEEFRSGTIAWGIGEALSGLALMRLAAGDPEHATLLLDEADSALLQVGPWFLSLGSYVRAILAVRHGQPDQSIALVRENLSRIRELRDQFAFVYALVPLAAAASLKGADAWTARILGARDAVMERTGIGLVDARVHDLLSRAERAARARLGPDGWAVAYSAGRRMSIDAMLNEIDEVQSGGGALAV